PRHPCSTLSLHGALPIYRQRPLRRQQHRQRRPAADRAAADAWTCPVAAAAAAAAGHALPPGRGMNAVAALEPPGAWPVGEHWRFRLWAPDARRAELVLGDQVL